MGCDIMKSRRGAAGSGAIEKRILMLGLDNSGKTSILLQLKENSFMPQSVPTIGMNIEQVQFRDYNLTFWDVGGQATKLWKHYFDSVDGLVFVLDSTDQSRIAKAKAELYRVGKDPALQQVPYLLMFNKIDLSENRMTLEELIEKMDVEQLSHNRVINFQECSAMTGEGIWEGITTMIEIFERTDPAKSTGAASTGADSVKGSGDATNNNPSTQSKTELPGGDNQQSSNPVAPKLGKPLEATDNQVVDPQQQHQAV